MSISPHQKESLRIVSLAPSATSILCAIGAKRALVGVTKWCADVAPVDNLPKLGDCWHMRSVEDILRLSPSLVLGSFPYRHETVATLLEHPLNFLAMNPRTLADVASDISLLGRITGHAREADRLNHKMRSEFSAIAQKCKKNARPVRIYCEAWPNPRICSPPWVAELAEICGAEMVVSAGEKVTEAQVAEANPEVIVLAWTATGDTANSRKTYEVPEWKDVPAIRSKRVFVIRDEWLNTPGPPLLHGARALHKIIASLASDRGRR